MKYLILAAGAALAIGLSAPAIATPAPTQTAPAASQHADGTQLAQRDRDRRRARERARRRARDGRHHRNPRAWRQRYPRAHVGRPRWSRGDRLYRDYRGPRYYVNDWRHYGLRHPPRGYRWVRVDNDFMLVAITTGIIMDIMLMNEMNRRYR